MIPIELNRKELSKLEFVKEAEWLETNGLGGWSSSTVSGINTRRFHGLYVRSLAPPLKRYVLVSDLAEELVVEGEKIELNTNEYLGDNIHPQGYLNLERFEKGYFPKFIYSGKNFELHKSVLFVHDTNTLLIKYEVKRLKNKAEFLLRPFLNDRPAEHLTLDYKGIDVNEEVDKTALNLHYFNVDEKLRLNLDKGEFTSNPDWYNDFFFSEEDYRGYDSHEHLYSPGHFNKAIKEGDSFFFTLSEGKVKSPKKLWDAEISRREKLTESTEKSPFWYESHLRLAADQFVVQRGKQKTILAGYPWFSDWGRDTMIALPGLCLTTGNYTDAKKIILAFAENIDEGMIPNRFVEGDEEKEYNTIDATLWFFNAIYEYCKVSGDYDILKNNLIDKLYSILNYHINGTRYCIKADQEDGLLYGGEKGVQLTWMDAKVGDWVVTPRIGKPVEINALWYNALCVFLKLSTKIKSKLDVSSFKELKSKIGSNFIETYHRKDGKGLYDNVSAEGKDDSIRPNQLIALSLPFTLVNNKIAKEVLAVCREELLTPYGMRSLSPSHDDYIPKYFGGQLERDGAYHQGTAWGWLIGPYLESVLKYEGVKGVKEVKKLLASYGDHLEKSGIGMASEVFDPTNPFTGRGCINQAWSVSELVRILDLTVER